MHSINGIFILMYLIKFKSSKIRALELDYIVLYYNTPFKLYILWIHCFGYTVQKGFFN